MDIKQGLETHYSQPIGIDSPWEHRITNAGSGGINSRIQGIKARARGFRNFQHYRSSILFHLGDLDLYPPAKQDAPK